MKKNNVSTDRNSMYPKKNLMSTKEPNLEKDGSIGYGDVSSIVYTIDTAPEDKKYKWGYLFGNLGKKKLERIQMDDTCFFSITDYRTAGKISDIIKKLPGITTDSHVIDGTACGGGDSISFAKHGFKKITSIELNPRRFKILCNNINVAGYENQIKTKQGNFIEIYPKLGKSDVVFLDAPWGGVDCIKEDKVDLFLSNIHIADICFNLRNMTKYVVLKVPTNFNLSGFKERLKEKNKEVRHSTMALLRDNPFRLRKLWLLVIEMKKEKNINFESTKRK